MMRYKLINISSIIHGKPLQVFEDSFIEHLLPDSRKIYSPATSLFFALKGPRRNGHQFISELYDKGVRNFIIGEKIDFSDFPEGNFILVNDTLEA